MPLPLSQPLGLLAQSAGARGLRTAGTRASGSWGGKSEHRSRHSGCGWLTSRGVLVWWQGAIWGPLQGHRSHHGGCTLVTYSPPKYPTT